ncbi:MAG: bifunctional metallophosphatase/5'-nucleotidase, partial [Pseudomonadota bacterium]
ASSLSASAEYRLTILHINDLHSRIEPISRFDGTCGAEDDAAGECFGGVARLKTFLDERRAALAAEGRNVLVLDAGDQFQGSLMYTTYKGAAEAEFMNAIGFDVMAVGNHEFDDGPEKLAEFIDAVDVPVVSGNLDVSTEPLLAGKVGGAMVIEVGGERIGIVSALAADTVETSSPGPNVVFADEVESVAAQAAALTADGVSKIVALTHVGLPMDIRIAQGASGVDAIVGGHSHTYLSSSDAEASGPYPVMADGADGVQVPIVQAYAYSKYVGELELVFDDAGVVVSAEGDAHVLDASVEADAGVAARVAELAGPIEELKATVVGATSAPIDGARESCRAGECEMGNLVADAMLDRVADQGVTLAIQNGGGLRASIDAGEVTMGEVLTVLPFQNTLATFRLSGAGVVAALENGVGRVEDGAGRFPQVAGLRYTWDPALPAGERIVSVEVKDGGGWAPIDPEAVYGVVTNNYMRGGGDGYDVFATDGMDAYDFGPGLEQVVADYIAAQGEYAPFLDGRVATP